MAEIEITILDENCTGKRGAKTCKDAHAAGRSVHMFITWDPDVQTLVMPTCHFETVEEGRDAIVSAYDTAHTITTDEELYAARAAKIPHKLPIGWIDPSRRR